MTGFILIHGAAVPATFTRGKLGWHVTSGGRYVGTWRTEAEAKVGFVRWWERRQR